MITAELHNFSTKRTFRAFMMDGLEYFISRGSNMYQSRTSEERIQDFADFPLFFLTKECYKDRGSTFNA